MCAEWEWVTWEVRGKRKEGLIQYNSARQLPNSARQLNREREKKKRKETRRKKKRKERRQQETKRQSQLTRSTFCRQERLIVPHLVLASCIVALHFARCNPLQSTASHYIASHHTA